MPNTDPSIWSLLQELDLGEWRKYLNEVEVLREFTAWPELAAELRNPQPGYNSIRPMSTGKFRTVKKAARRYAAESVEAVNPLAHRYAHFEETRVANQLLRRVLKKSFGISLHRAMEQADDIAALLHDCNHPGSTFRALMKPELMHLLWRPDLGLHVAVEWVSCIAANEFGIKHGMPLLARIFMIMKILSTTFGGGTPDGITLGIPIIQPVGIWGTGIRAADVAPQRTIRLKLVYSHLILWAERGATLPPTTWLEYIENRLGFFRYILFCYDELDAAVQRAYPQVGERSITGILGWRSHLAKLTAEFKAMADGNDPDLRAFVEQDLLSNHHVVLT